MIVPLDGEKFRKLKEQVEAELKKLPEDEQKMRRAYFEARMNQAIDRVFPDLKKNKEGISHATD